MDHLLKKLDTIFNYVYQNEHSSFYRDFYKNTVNKDYKIESIKHWQKLPLLTKNELQTASLYKRLFIPIKNVELLRASSGTSGKPPILSFRSSQNKIIFNLPLMPKGVLLSLTAPYRLEEAWRKLDPDMTIISADTHYLETTVLLIKDSNIDCLCLPLFMYDLLTPYLIEHKIVEKIKTCIYFGENISDKKLKCLKTFFYNASFPDTVYGASELHNASCFGIYFDPEYGEIFKPSNNIYVEIIDENSNEVIEEENKIGKLILTPLDIKNNASPVIRYVVGDTAMYTKWDANHDSRQFSLAGRLDTDRIYMSGGVLHKSEFDRVIRQFSDLISNVYQFHYRLHDDYLFNEGVLYVTPRKHFNLKMFTQTFMSKLQVTPSSSYSDGVQKGIYKPLICKVLKKQKDADKFVKLK